MFTTPADHSPNSKHKPLSVLVYQQQTSNWGAGPTGGTNSLLWWTGGGAEDLAAATGNYSLDYFLVLMIYKYCGSWGINFMLFKVDVPKKTGLQKVHWVLWVWHLSRWAFCLPEITCCLLVIRLNMSWFSFNNNVMAATNDYFQFCIFYFWKTQTRKCNPF